jgi:maltose-binding protein MalE
MLLAAVGLTAVVGLAGCGTSKSSEGASTSTSTSTTATATAAASGDASVASFTQQANALCTSFEKQVDDMITQGMTDSSAADTDAGQAEFLTKGNDLVGQLISQMKALPQPESLSTQLESIYAQAAQVQSLTEQGVTLLQQGQGQSQQFQALSDQASTASDSLDQQFQAVGITVCSSGSDSTATTAG